MNALLIAAFSLASATDALAGLSGLTSGAAGLSGILAVPEEIISEVASELGIEGNNLLHLLQGLGGSNDRLHTLVERAASTNSSSSTSASATSATSSSSNAAVMQGVVGGSLLMGVAAMLL